MRDRGAAESPARRALRLSAPRARATECGMIASIVKVDCNFFATSPNKAEKASDFLPHFNKLCRK
jgi:hypothetical protein